MVLLPFLSNSSLRPVTETFAHATFVLVAIVKKIFGLKIILTWHLSKPKIYQDHKFFGLNTSLDPQFIGTNIFLDPQVFVPKIILTPKNFTSKHFLDPTFFYTLQIFWTKISLDQFFLSQLFFHPNFFSPKIFSGFDLLLKFCAGAGLVLVRFPISLVLYYSDISCKHRLSIYHAQLS